MSIFKGKTVVITGAGMGLGLAASKVVAHKGANLSIVDYNKEALEKAKEEILSIAPQAKVCFQNRFRIWHHRRIL